MREIVIISGKGGTGKTTVCAAFAHLMGKGVLCDLDVDAPDLHIICDPQIIKDHQFISGQEASIDLEKCTACGACADNCRFEAITNNGEYRVDAVQCEGCGVCDALCPASAIIMRDKYCGDWHESRSRFGPMLHAQLFPGEENSGRLVSLLKQQAREFARSNALDFILCDGSPGIGCPVISSLSGAHLAVAVIEPTPSGRHDFMRVAELCDHFRIPVSVLINKADLNLAECDGIKNLCRERGYDVVGEIPFSQEVIDSMINKKAVTESDTAIAKNLRKTWDTVRAKALEPPRVGTPLASMS